MLLKSNAAVSVDEMRFDVCSVVIDTGKIYSTKLTNVNYFVNIN